MEFFTESETVFTVDPKLDSLNPIPPIEPACGMGDILSAESHRQKQVYFIKKW